MSTATRRILTTHAGSLPRPPKLTRLYARRARGEAFNEAALAAEGAKAVTWVVAQQRAAGIDLVSNGEQQRESFVLYLRRRLTGIGGTGARAPFADIEAYPGFKAERLRYIAGREAVSNIAQLPKCIGSIAYQGHAELEAELATFEAALAAAGLPKAGAFVTAASPGILASIVKDEHYGDLDAYLTAIAAALRVEYEAIVARGFTLQIDAPDLAMERHTAFAQRPLGDFQAFIERVVAAINRALVNVPREKVRLHACWGNYEAPHQMDIPLADIIDIVFLARPSAISFEAANPRHAHEWAVFETVKLPNGKVLIPGVLESKSNFIEHPELIAQRIGRYANLVGRENVMLGTDCGYGTWVGQAAVDPDVVWCKLASMAEGARLASKQFWRNAAVNV